VPSGATGKSASFPAPDPSILRTPVPLPVPALPAMGPAVFSGFDLVQSVVLGMYCIHS
jgi:hypothetical protein